MSQQAEIQELIQEILYENGSLTCREISQVIGIEKEKVRRTLTDLEKAEVVRKSQHSSVKFINFSEETNIGRPAVSYELC